LYSRRGRAAPSERRLHDMGEKLKEIEKQQFGEDGFDDAVEQNVKIEQALGLRILRSSPRRRRPWHDRSRCN
jgi:hypothetical protein